MAHLDRFLSVLVSNRASALRLAADQVAHLSVGDAPRAITKQPFSAAQLLMIVREIAPADSMVQLERGADASFTYQTPDGVFHAYGPSSGGKLSIEISPVAAGLGRVPSEAGRVHSALGKVNGNESGAATPSPECRVPSPALYGPLAPTPRDV